MADFQMETLMELPSARKDYAIAGAAHSLAWHYLNNGDISKAAKYYKQGMEICEELQAYNSDVFLRSLYAMINIPMYCWDTRHNEHLAAKLDLVKKCLYPYYTLTRIKPSEFTVANVKLQTHKATERCNKNNNIHNNNVDEQEEEDYGAPASLSYTAPEYYSHLQQQMPVSLKNLYYFSAGNL